MVGHSFRGGSSLITRLLFKQFGIDTGPLTAREFRAEIFNKRLLENITEAELIEVLKSPEFLRIKFVRCPYRRAVSSYLYTMGKELEGPSARVRPLRTTSPRLMAIKRPIFVSFVEFLTYLSTINLEAFSCDNHFAMQSMCYGNTSLPMIRSAA